MMELKDYWRILRRRWLLLLVPAVVVLAVGLLTYQRPSPAYNVGVRFIVGQEPSSGADLSDEERLANWHASEYIAHGLNDWVRGGQFAELVSQRLAAEGRSIPPPVIQGSLAADNTRSKLELYMNHGDPELLAAMITAAAAVLVEENHLGLPQLGGQPAVVNQLDQPVVNPSPAGMRSRLDLLIRVGLAVAAGLGLALMAEYLDPTLRTRAELEALGLSVLGEIPRE
jgi:capsular polysaccharide biosynthesis protein